MALPITIIEKENILKSYPKERLTQELAQPTGNFPLFLVASRLKEVEEMEKAAQADMAKQQMSQQAGSVYERMVTGQPETPSQGSFAQNRPMSPGVPDVPSQIAAQPVPQPQQQPTGMPMAVAANGGYAGNLPTVRMQGDPREWVPTTPRDRVAIAEMAQRGGLPRGGSFETGGATTGYDPTKQGLVALLAKKAQRAKMLAALGQPLVTSYGVDSPYGTGAGFVKKYADDGGYVNNLPTVRMQGVDGPEELDAILSPSQRYENLRTGLWDIMRPTRTEAPRFGPDIQRALASEYDALTANRRSLLDDPSKLTTLEQRIGPTISNFSQITPPPNVAPIPLPQNPWSPLATDQRNPANWNVESAPPIPYSEPLPRPPAEIVSEPEPEVSVVSPDGEESVVSPPPPPPPGSVESMEEHLRKLAFQTEQPAASVFQTAEQIAAGKKEEIDRLAAERKTFTTTEEARIAATEASNKIAVGKIETAMQNVSNFAEGGKLPEKLQGQYINELLMIAGGALLANPTWHQAGAAFIEGGIKVKDKHRKQYAESLNTLLTNESQLQTLRTTLNNAVSSERTALAKSAYEFNRGDEEAAAAWEKAAIQNNNDVKQLEIAESQAKAQQINAMANALNSIYPDRKTSAIERTIDRTYDLYWGESVNDPAMRDEWFYKGADGKYQRDNIRAAPFMAMSKDLIERSTKTYPGTLPASVGGESRRWSAAVSKGNTAWSVFKDGAFTGESGKAVKAVIPYLNDNFGYEFTSYSGPEELAVVPLAEFMEAWLNTHNRAEIQQGGEWGDEYSAAKGQGFVVGEGPQDPAGIR